MPLPGFYEIKKPVRVNHKKVKKPASMNKESGTSQKQAPEVFYEERCSWKFRKILRKTPVPEPLFLWQNTSGLLLVTSEIHMTVASGSFERKKQYRKKFSKKVSRKCPLFYNFALLRRKVTIPYNKVLREVLSPSLVLTLTSISPTSKILFY